MADKNGNTSANLGFEDKLWKAADALRSNMDAAEYKHVVLGLIFLKYISDTFEEQHTRLEAERDQGADPEDPDEYRAVNTFWVPKEARWAFLLASAKQPTIGKTVDDAMLAVERDNPSLKGVLPKDYAHPRLDKQRLGQLIDMIGNIGLGDKANRSKDILGRVYEYFLSQFASAEGKKGGQFYTPRCIVQLLVEMLTPYKGRVYDPCCGSGGMFVQSEKFVEAHGGRVRRHLRLRAGIEPHHLAAGADEPGDPRHRRQPGAGARRQLPPRPAPRPQGRLRPGQSALQRQRLARANCCATTSAGSTARRRPATPTTPGCSTSSITWRRPAWRASCWPTARCPPTSPAKARSARPSSRPTWWIAWSRCPASCSTPRRSPSACGSSPRQGRSRCGAARIRPYADRRGEILFIDARKLGTLTDRVHRELTDDDIARIADTYHAWRGDRDGVGAGSPRPYIDVPGFCKAATLDDVRGHGHVLTPGRYVGAEEVEDDGEPFEEVMARLAETLRSSRPRPAKLDAAIAANLEELGYGG